MRIKRQKLRLTKRKTNIEAVAHLCGSPFEISVLLKKPRKKVPQDEKE